MILLAIKDCGKESIHRMAMGVGIKKSVFVKKSVVYCSGGNVFGKIWIFSRTPRQSFRFPPLKANRYNK